FLFEPVYGDEAATLTQFVFRPWYFALSDYSIPNNHIFHTFLAHVIYKIFGNQLWILRLPVFVSGICLIPLIFGINTYLFDKYTALLSTVFVAAATVLVHYSVDARGYNILILIFYLLLALVLYLRSNNNLFVWLLFSVIASLGFYTIPLMLYPYSVLIVLVLENLFNLDNKERKKYCVYLLISILLTIILTFVLYLPVIISFGVKQIIDHPWTISNQLSFIHFFERLLPAGYSLISEWNSNFSFVVKGIIFVGYLLLLFLHKKILRFKKGILIITSACFLLLIIITFQRIIPPNRAWLFLFPLYISFGCMGVIIALKNIFTKYQKINSNLIIKSLVPIFLLIGTFHTIKNFKTQDYGGIFRDAKKVTDFLKKNLNENSCVIFVGKNGSPLVYYFNKIDVSLNYLYPKKIEKCKEIYIVKNSVKSLNKLLIDIDFPQNDVDLKEIRTFTKASVYYGKVKDGAGLRNIKLPLL
ncbi:glycosyltransferase family 39 protein, partial [bacterium]